jgi:hypothetical protein
MKRHLGHLEDCPMSDTLVQELQQALKKIDRPGTFCVSGSGPAVLPGLEVGGLGLIGLPLNAGQAEELKKHCEQAPYGKGEQTLVDTSVRRVWRLTPDRFTLTSPDWQPFLKETLRKVQDELGLKGQKLQSHLYDLLLYEPGSFFLPHRDGEKLDRMVATLVVVLPSSFEGGELVVRHEGQEKVIDFGGEQGRFRTHYAAFYADCEHEIRPLRAGHRLCLVYNLTLAKSKKHRAAPRQAEHVERIARVLRAWADAEAPRKLAVTLEHQYTQDGLAWNTLKGVDRSRALALREAARQAGCQAFLALLTLHESGSAEDGGYGYGYRRRRWDEKEEEYSGPHTMGEVYETSLSAEHWTDSEGNRVPLGALHVDESEVLAPDVLKEVEPEEQYEGYTGNEGMTLDRWYRHAAVFLWPARRHWDVLCDAGTQKAVDALQLLVQRWQKVGKKEAAALRADCLAFAAAILARWQSNPYPHHFTYEYKPSPLFGLLEALDEPGPIKTYLGEVLPTDPAQDPGQSLVAICRKHALGSFVPELGAAFKGTTSQTLNRNVRLLERLCLALPGEKEEWGELCETLARDLVVALEQIDHGPAQREWWERSKPRTEVLTGLARALLATGQNKLLSRLVDHALESPQKYPLTEAHVAALTALGPWIAKHVQQPCPPLSYWLQACCAQLEAQTAHEPQPPADFRREAAIACNCADCAVLKRFLHDPHEKVYRFSAAQHRRSHLDQQIHAGGCDLTLQTEEKGRPYTLVCTKNLASYQAKLRKFKQDQEHLAVLRAIQAGVPK